MTIFEILQQLDATPSTNAKQAILEANKHNNDLKQCFYYAYNPRFNYWMKMSNFPRSYGTNEIDSKSFSVLDDLINRTVTGDAARDMVYAYMITLTREAQEVFGFIINHDLRCGTSDTLASRVWPNIVPEYPCMLCSKFDAKAQKYLAQFENNCGFAAQKKSDGGRLIIKVDSCRNVTYHSRNGNELNLFGVFDSYFREWIDCVFDGELIVKTSSGKPDRKMSNGFYTKAVRGTLTKEEALNFSVDLWDIVPLDEYMSVGTVPYSERYKLLKTIGFDGKVEIIETEFVQTLAECVEFYDRMRADGQEGAIIKVANAVWEDARSKNAVKLKAVSDCDARCVGVEAGTGKYAGMIGSLQCETEDGLVKFSVGTGLKDEDRQRDPSYYIGNIVEVVYNEVISSKGKTTKSLFLPVYKQVRFDKNVANTLQELK